MKNKLQEQARYFVGERFSVFANPITIVIGSLNLGLEGGCGSVGVHASKKGVRITIDGRTIVKGKTPSELLANHKVAQAKAQAAVSEVKPA